MKPADSSPLITHRRRYGAVWLIFITAIIMGLPTIRGGFVGGDDHRLVLNHVLVNRPSLTHAVELFRIFHRDLYQPLPLLSFQMEFAIGQLFGLFDRGIEGATWFFHLNNVLLHAINAGLVWFVLRMLHSAVVANRKFMIQATDSTSSQKSAESSVSIIAAMAALLFAVHPMQTEVVAWLNGRMMLMSTLFALASLLSFHYWINLAAPSSARQRWNYLGWAAITVLLVLFCSISKVRIGLPVLMGIVLLVRRNLWNRRSLILWSVCTIVVGVFVLLNVRATAQAHLFSDAAEHLRGPRTVRVILAIDHYLRHLVWPVGLASYYPTPPQVHWSDRETWQASLVALPVLLFWIIASLRFSIARWAGLWFFSTMAATLPFVPARNILAADRYMYLPIIGLFWLIAVLLYRVYDHGKSLSRNPLLRQVMVITGCGVVVVMIGMCWHLASFYETPLKKTARIVQIFPDVPRVHEKLGWSYYKLGLYDHAIECAQKELRHDHPNVRSGAYQLLGMTAMKTGDTQEALRQLHRAVEIDPEDALARYRLATVYDELGRFDEAVTYYVQAVEAAPQHNPTINRLAGVYRKLHRPVDARAMYEQALRSNPYDVNATMGLVELDIQRKTQESNLTALNRLQTLLDWMPDNIDARVHLGVVYHALGQPDRAINAYTKALGENPLHVTAALNLAQIFQATGRDQQAATLYERAVQGGLHSIDQAGVIHDFYIDRGALQKALELWEKMKEQFPQSEEVQRFSTWTMALSGNLQQAGKEWMTISTDHTTHPLRAATWVLITLSQKRYDDARSAVDTLCSMSDQARDARRRLLGALEVFDERYPGVVWTYCLATQLLIAQGQLDVARAFIQLCEQHCDGPSCREHAQSLRIQLTKKQPVKP